MEKSIVEPTNNPLKKHHYKENGFGDHGGYMAAKIHKLEEQFTVLQKEFQRSSLFEGKSSKIPNNVQQLHN
jgi:hypothetical protein